MINSDINFESVEKLKTNDYLKINTNFIQSTEYNVIPKYFNWLEITDEDDEIVKEKKSKITPPADQYRCGSCWAVTVCTSVSDSFIISNITKWNPNISYTYALINYPQKQCKGGSPYKLLKDIQNYGIPSKNCINYYWCDKNQKCKTKISSSHFNQDLSHLIPSEKNKCIFKSQKLFYRISNIKLVLVENDDMHHIQRIRDIIKEHILISGPCIGGFIVFKNFKSGDYSTTNNIYFEKANYPNKGFSFYNTSSDNISGAHAVSIIGWGEEKDVLLSDGTISNVPYWICRNSWGVKWGTNGTFKIAMYPFNKKSQFEKNISITNNEGYTHSLGGILLYDVTELPKKKLMDNISNNSKIIPYLNSKEKENMQIDEDVLVQSEINNDNINFQKYENNKNLYFLQLIILTIIVIYLFKKAFQ